MGWWLCESGCEGEGEGGCVCARGCMGGLEGEVLSLWLCEGGCGLLSHAMDGCVVSAWSSVWAGGVRVGCKGGV